MGTSSSGAELGRKLVTAANNLSKANRVGVDNAAKAVDAAIRARLQVDVPSRSLRSGAKTGRSTGRALSTRVSQLKNQPDNPASIVSARGPWQIIERPTKRHRIEAKAARRDQAKAVRAFLTGQKANIGGGKGARVLKLNGGFARYVDHPGTPGKRTFERGVQAGTPLVSPAIKRETVRALTSVFG